MDYTQPKLLIVDDNPKNLQVLGKTLEQLKYQVEFSINGESALEWIKNQVFDLILLDIMMPGMNGLEVCKLIRTNKNYDDVPIIFLSAETDKKTILEGFELGAQDYITKPFDSRELLARVKTHLELKFSREQLKLTNQILELKVAERTVELHTSNEELAKVNEELIELDKVKTEFLNIISHEIRTPLNGILGPIQLIKDNLKDNKLTELFKILDDSVSRLEKFSLTALTITELKAGVRKDSFINVNLYELIQIVLIAINGISKSKNIKFETGNISKELIIKGDLKLLKICLTGILENAVIYSPLGGTIFIRVANQNNHISCEICDEGPGFSEIALKNLFKLFRPGEPHMDQNIGVDLSLARLIMEAHKGKLVAENLPDKGAVIRLIFSPNDETQMTE